jgi:hypothetical protein
MRVITAAARRKPGASANGFGEPRPRPYLNLLVAGGAGNMQVRFGVGWAPSNDAGVQSVS